MRRGRHQDNEAVRPVLVELPEVDPRLRDEPDNDPLIDEMLDRLRNQLSAMIALDEWGRPVAWRTVVRLALGPTLERLRDAETSAALAQHVIRLPSDGPTLAEPASEIMRTSADAVGWPPTSSLDAPSRLRGALGHVPAERDDPGAGGAVGT